jgi:hypothetical protein
VTCGNTKDSFSIESDSSSDSDNENTPMKDLHMLSNSSKKFSLRKYFN